VGRRSRKRPAPGATRAARDPERRERAPTAPTAHRRTRRPSIEQRPPAPWGRFPLGELVVLLGIVLMLWGLASWRSDGNLKFAAGLAVASLAGLELSLREHLAGYRSHTSLLAAVAAFALVSILALGPGPHVLGALLVIAGVVFAISFYALRRLFKRRSGGLGFR
jgi:hypothetical protein